MNTKQKIKNWEIRDRVYHMLGKAPLTYKVKSSGLLWFDEEKGINRELRYAVNQNSIFIDEQDGTAQMGHVVFQDGMLYVPRHQQPLQKLLSIYHPDIDVRFTEHDEQEIANDEVADIELEIEAVTLVQTLEIDALEAIMRTELGSSVMNLSSKELKRDAYKFAKSKPELFIELSRDEDIKLRNLANRAVEANILKLADGGTTFKFAANGKKVMTVPFDQNPYAALSQYFKTDDGVTLMKSLIKKLD